MNNSEADWSLIAHKDITSKMCTRDEKEHPRCLLNQKREKQDRFKYVNIQLRDIV